MGMSLGSFASRVVATKVVATDGTGDFTTIQAALNDLPSTGGVVYVKEGTYTITATITFPNDNISIKGAGKSTKVQTSGDITAFTITSKAGITIEDIYIYGSQEVAYADSFGIKITNPDKSIIRGCWIEHTKQQCIYVGGTDGDIIVKDCFIEDTSAIGIDIAAGVKVIVKNNFITNCTNSPIQITGITGAIIANNHVYSNGTGGDVFGIVLVNSDDCVVAGNVCTDNYTNEIRVHTDACDNNIIVGNMCKGTHTTAIVDNGTGTQLAHNVTN